MGEVHLFLEHLQLAVVLVVQTQTVMVNQAVRVVVETHQITKLVLAVLVGLAQAAKEVLAEMHLMALRHHGLQVAVVEQVDQVLQHQEQH
jgi:hypothetical protein